MGRAMKVSEREFLETTNSQLGELAEAAETHHHVVLARMLAAARRETEVLMREHAQSRHWPRSPEDRWVGRQPNDRRHEVDLD